MQDWADVDYLLIFFLILAVTLFVVAMYLQGAICYFTAATSCLADMFTASSVIFGDILVPPRLRLRHQSIGSSLSSEGNRSILDVSPAYFCFVFASSERAEEKRRPLDHATLLLLLRAVSFLFAISLFLPRHLRSDSADGCRGNKPRFQKPQMETCFYFNGRTWPEWSERTADVRLNEWGAVVVTPLMKMFERVDGSTLSGSNWRLLKFLREALDLKKICLRRRYVNRGFAISMFTCLSPPCTQREREKERHMTGWSGRSALAEGKK